MQIDQDPGDYRVQRPDGTWTTRVNKPLCRWMAIAGLATTAMFGASFVSEGGTIIAPLLFTAFGFSSGLLFALSLKSIDW